MDIYSQFSPWLKAYIDHLLKQDFGEVHERILGEDIAEFRRGFTVDILELGIARSLFLSTWEKLKREDRSLYNRSESIRNFIAHGVEQVNIGPPPFARLVNVRYYSQGYNVRISTNEKGEIVPEDMGEFKKFLGLNRNRDLYSFVEDKPNSDFAMAFIRRYLPTRNPNERTQAGITAAEVFQLQQGLVTERDK